MSAGLFRGGWKMFAKLVGPGIPAPTGQYRVGCVDLMHQLPGDEEKGGLLVRLTYPTEATPGAGYPYSSWYPDRRYIKGFMKFVMNGVSVSEDELADANPDSKFHGFQEMIPSLLFITDPQIPALEGAPLHRTDTLSEILETFFFCMISTECLVALPVIVLSHGLGGMRTAHSAIACDLASHGYVVAAVEHRWVYWVGHVTWRLTAMWWQLWSTGGYTGWVM
jgi:platelet-activating factor acetylhydrolase